MFTKLKHYSGSCVVCRYISHSSIHLLNDGVKYRELNHQEASMHSLENVVRLHQNMLSILALFELEVFCHDHLTQLY